MVGYTAQGASDSQWFPNEPVDVWEAVRAYLGGKRMRSCDDRTMRLEANLGMTAMTGNCVASVSVQASPQGGSTLHFNGRMGAFSQQNIGAQRRVESERTKLINAVSAKLPEVAPPPLAAPPSSTAGGDLASQLQQIANLRDTGVLTNDEFEAAKRKLLS